MDFKVEAIRDLAPPATNKELCSVLDVLGYHRSVINVYSYISAGLTKGNQESLGMDGRS